MRVFKYPSCDAVQRPSANRTPFSRICVGVRTSVTLHGSSKGLEGVKAPGAPVRRSQTQGATATFAAAVQYYEAQVQTSSATIVKITLPYETGFGQVVKLVGDSPSLGCWDVTNGFTLTWSEGNIWRGEMTMTGRQKLTFKCVVTDGKMQKWEGGDNRVVQIPANASEVQVYATWDSTRNTQVAVIASADSANQAAPSPTELASSTLGFSKSVDDSPANAGGSPGGPFGFTSKSEPASGAFGFATRSEPARGVGSTGFDSPRGPPLEGTYSNGPLQKAVNPWATAPTTGGSTPSSSSSSRPLSPSRSVTTSSNFSFLPSFADKRPPTPKPARSTNPSFAQPTQPGNPSTTPTTVSVPPPPPRMTPRDSPSSIPYKPVDSRRSPSPSPMRSTALPTVMPTKQRANSPSRWSVPEPVPATAGRTAQPADPNTNPVEQLIRFLSPKRRTEEEQIPQSSTSAKIHRSVSPSRPATVTGPPMTGVSRPISTARNSRN